MSESGWLKGKLLDESGLNQELQVLVTILKDECETNDLRLNASKTMVVFDFLAWKIM